MNMTINKDIESVTQLLTLINAALELNSEPGNLSLSFFQQKHKNFTRS